MNIGSDTYHQAGLQPYHSSPFFTSASANSSPTSPLFPVQFSNQSPVSPHFPVSYRGPSPLPPSHTTAQPVPPLQAAHHSAASSQSSSRSVTSLSSRPPTQIPRPSGSQASLATTASTSSRTLKTPHATKVDFTQPQPTIASSSTLNFQGEHDGSPTPAMPLKEREHRSDYAPREVNEHRSPTPTQRSIPARQAPPPMPSGALPLAPNFTMPLQTAKNKANSHPFMTASSPPRIAGRTKGPPTPLNIRKKEASLSQDWIQVPQDVPDEYKAKSQSPVSKQTVVPPTKEKSSRSEDVKKGGQEPTLVPMKLKSPMRPGFDRASTAPTMLPVSAAERAQRQGRGSLDQLRSASPNPPRPRLNTMSTPPAALLEAAQARSNGGRLNMFRSNSVQSPPQLKTRKSEDLLRPSMGALRAAGSAAASGISKESKGEKLSSKEQQRALGVAQGATPSNPSSDTDRKGSGLSLKKSSGALKALFNRGASGKAKDRVETPPLPDLQKVEKEKEKNSKKRPSTAPKDQPTKAFSSKSVNPFEWTAESEPQTWGLSANQETERKSFENQRGRYPAPSNVRPPSALLASSYEPSDYTPALSGPSRQRLPSRDLPPAPLPSPVGQQISMPAITGSSDQMEERKAQFTKLGEALPSTSLPYLSPLRASFLLESQESETTQGGSSANTSDNVTTVSSDPNSTQGVSLNFEKEHATLGSFLDEPFKATQPLNLLQLPDLDLDFSLSFDSIGFSPSTPRRSSPQKSRNRLSPASPQRSLTTRLSPRPSPKITRSNSERRRSKSFDGAQSPILWGITTSGFDSPDVSKLFASSSSSSAPVLSEPLEPTASEDSHHHRDRESSQSLTASSRLSGQSQSSSRHERTLSNASSTNNTASPSPPRTPEDAKSSLFSDLPPLPTRAKSYNPPPSIPLPALPTTAPTPVTPPAQISSALVLPSLAPAAVIEEVLPIEEKTPVVRAARFNQPVLHKPSAAVVPDVSVTTVNLARDMERALHT